MPSSEYEQLCKVVAALSAVGLLWESNCHEEITNSGLRYIDSKSRRPEEVPDELKQLYSIVGKNWEGVSGIETFIERDLARDYSVKLLDASLISFQCTFENDTLIKQRVMFRQNPFFKPYESDELYLCLDSAGEIGILEYWKMFGVKKPTIREVISLRFDYDPNKFRVHEHPRSHLHLGDSENCRICVESPCDPNSLFSLIVCQFYPTKREDFLDIVNTWPDHSKFDRSIHEDELQRPFFRWGDDTN